MARPGRELTEEVGKGRAMAERMGLWMARLIRGLGSLAILLLGTAGAPVALASLGGNPLPDELTWNALRHALSTSVDGMILVNLIAIVGWLAWLAFTLSVISELLALSSRQRIRIRLPGLDAPQRFAAGLLISVITMISVPHAMQADPDSGRQIAAVAAAPDPPAVIIEGAETLQPPALAAPRTKRVDQSRHHVVQAGDDLWSLAERYYGEGQDWRKIAAANPSVLTGGPDRLQVGWRLRIPDLDKETRASDRVITVRRGDTLSSIAERELGTPARWTDIFHLNRVQLSDPDEIAVGMRLMLPEPKNAARPKSTPHHQQQGRTENSLPQHERPAPHPLPTAAPAQPSASPA